MSRIERIWKNLRIVDQDVQLAVNELPNFISTSNYTGRVGHL